VVCGNGTPSLVPQTTHRGAGTPVLQTGGPTPVPPAVHGHLPSLGISLACSARLWLARGTLVGCRTWRPCPAVAVCVQCCGPHPGAGLAVLASLRVVAQKRLHLCQPLNYFSSGLRAAGQGRESSCLHPTSGPLLPLHTPDPDITASITDPLFLLLLCRADLIGAYQRH